VRKGIATAAIVATVCLLLSGCATESSRKAEYKRATTLPPLEVPPDLTAPELQGGMDLPQSYSAHMAQGGDTAGVQVLPQQENVRVLRDGDMRWLQVEAAPEQLWARLREFWQQQGLEVRRDEPQLGIMETQWAENKADVPGDWIQSMVSRVFKNAYTAPTRDKFRLRVERSASGGTEIFVTHYGVEEVQRGQNVESYDTIWQNRPSDPELVTEMLNRMMVYLGTPQARAEAQLAAAAPAVPQARVRLEADGLVVNETFPRAWRRVGIALDRLGLVVEDRDRSAGLYYIRAIDQIADAGRAKKGFFSGLFSGADAAADQVAPGRILLQDGGETTRVTVQDMEGRHDTSAAARKILQQLETELR